MFDAPPRARGLPPQVVGFFPVSHQLLDFHTLEAAPVTLLPPPAVSPAASPAPSPAVDRARVGLWVRNTGIVVLLFLLYQLYGTGFQEGRAQAALRASYLGAQSSASADASTVGGPPPGGSARAGTAPLAAVPASLATAHPGGLPSQAVAEIIIPAIHVDQFVVDGTSDADLQKGPGHYTGTPYPGQPGNVAIAGHRTTFGAPFNRLGDLQPGDTIITKTPTGTYLYVVAGKENVAPTQTSVVDDYGDNRLTLTTCTPEFLATQRLVVVAALQGPLGGSTDAAPARVSAPPTPTKIVKAIAGSAATAGLRQGTRGFDFGALPLAALFVAALVGLGLSYQYARRYLPRLAAAVVLGPIWLCGLLLLFEHLARFLPANV